jgi:hypothetical protein
MLNRETITGGGGGKAKGGRGNYVIRITRRMEGGWEGGRRDGNEGAGRSEEARGAVRG